MDETVPHTLLSIETNGQELLSTTLFPDSSLMRKNCCLRFNNQDTVSNINTTIYSNVYFSAA